MLIITSMPQIGEATDKAGPLASYPRLLIESGSVLQISLAALFMISVMAVMLSTIDSAIIATMYAFVADVRRCRFEANYEDPTLSANPLAKTAASADMRAELLAGKKAAFLFVVALCALVVLVGAKLGKPEQLIAVIVGFYGGMLSLLPAVLAMLVGFRRWTGPPVAIGIAAGVAAAVGFTVWGVFEAAKSWYAVFAGPAVAGLVPLFLSPLFRVKR
ncbi:MAG: hypothetical protein HY721_34040 [Planctomycetes bacterium]|nr:hypothetical protein [Planctomycetota bacterium]